jgi:REP element-mobilizing transposase RayT
MPRGLVRYHSSGQFHFLTFSCYKRQPLLAMRVGYSVFEQALERVRQTHGLVVAGYVLMPEHVHLLVSEPRADPSQARSRPLSRRHQRNSRRLESLNSGSADTTTSMSGARGQRKRNSITCTKTQLSADWRHDRRTGHGPAFVTTQLWSVAQSRSNPLDSTTTRRPADCRPRRTRRVMTEAFAVSHPCRDETAPWMGHPGSVPGQERHTWATRPRHDFWFEEIHLNPGWYFDQTHPWAIRPHMRCVTARL